MKKVFRCSQNIFDAVAEVTNIVVCLTPQGVGGTIFVLKIMMTLTHLFDLLISVIYNLLGLNYSHELRFPVIGATLLSTVSNLMLLCNISLV